MSTEMSSFLSTTSTIITTILTTNNNNNDNEQPSETFFISSVNERFIYLFIIALIIVACCMLTMCLFCRIYTIERNISRIRMRSKSPSTERRHYNLDLTPAGLEDMMGPSSNSSNVNPYGVPSANMHTNNIYMYPQSPRTHDNQANLMKPSISKSVLQSESLNTRTSRLVQPSLTTPTTQTTIGNFNEISKFNVAPPALVFKYNSDTGSLELCPMGSNSSFPLKQPQCQVPTRGVSHRSMHGSISNNSGYTSNTNDIRNAILTQLRMDEDAHAAKNGVVDNGYYKHSEMGRSSSGLTSVNLSGVSVSLSGDQDVVVVVDGIKGNNDKDSTCTFSFVESVAACGVNSYNNNQSSEKGSNVTGDANIVTKFHQPKIVTSAETSMSGLTNVTYGMLTHEQSKNDNMHDYTTRRTLSNTVKINKTTTGAAKVVGINNAPVSVSGVNNGEEIIVVRDSDSVDSDCDTNNNNGDARAELAQQLRNTNMPYTVHLDFGAKIGNTDISVPPSSIDSETRTTSTGVNFNISDDEDQIDLMQPIAEVGEPSESLNNHK